MLKYVFSYIVSLHTYPYNDNWIQENVLGFLTHFNHLSNLYTIRSVYLLAAKRGLKSAN